MRNSCGVLVPLFALLIAAAATLPAAEVSGWRGDGSGRYPERRSSARLGSDRQERHAVVGPGGKPEKGTTPTAQAAMPDGVIRHWLVLGPLPVSDETKAENILPGAEGLSPDDGDSAWATTLGARSRSKPVAWISAPH